MSSGRSRIAIVTAAIMGRRRLFNHEFLTYFKSWPHTSLLASTWEILVQEGLDMLVFMRKPGERVLVGDDVEVTVLEVDGDRVKLGFNAPRYVPICRAEIHQELSDLLAVGADAEQRCACR